MVTSKKPDGRIWKACLSCRRKKIKCDGEDPCHNCQSRDQICEFQDSHDNASASRRYAASFEERCQHMDDLCKPSAACPRDEGEQPVFPASQPGIEIPKTRDVPSGSLGCGLESPSEASDKLRSNDVRSYPTAVDPVCHMIADSYGRLRYLGGVADNLMVEAVQSLSPGGASKPTPSVEAGEVSLPFFIQGQVWPEIPYLPQPKDLGRPPHYISDMLVNIYFDQLHYTFPILFKPDFMRRYQQITAPKRDAVIDSVFFAVCACASSLLPRALLVNFASTGEVFIEQVQCLGLLALCSAGWNTPSQSWRFAGQAVRIAQDLGLHVSSLFVETQVSRCVWWSVFTLDCLMSICLGRPMAADQADCCCDLPFDTRNEDLEHFGIPQDASSLTSSPMRGFLAFARLCRIAAREHQFYSSHQIKERVNPPNNWAKLLPTLDAFIRELDDWLQHLPKEVCFSANPTQSGPNLAMCVIVFILHSATIMNIYRPLAAHYPPPTQSPGTPASSASLADPSSECINAARSCIQATELICERVPPSHHLAFCVQYLTISGILLLSMMDEGNTPVLLPDVKHALHFLGSLGAIWPGASRSRLILDKLLQNPPRRAAEDNRAANSNLPFPSLPILDGLLWEQVPDSSEVFLNLNTFGE
ncbi:transcription factor domain-containing protein [Aspergillus lucknowensis]|uniref:Fungal-specific transcription factor domain-containing protein n=1 Tax=Aspergillus lucknowensis TaxID=176173 RepID=A0ABR4LQA3_9EURO